jgi:hypothetical protein
VASLSLHEAQVEVIARDLRRCDCCGRRIPTGDIRLYRLEAGKPDVMPAVCVDCAEDQDRKGGP